MCRWLWIYGSCSIEVLGVCSNVTTVDNNKTHCRRPTKIWMRSLLAFAEKRKHLPQNWCAMSAWWDANIVVSINRTCTAKSKHLYAYSQLKKIQFMNKNLNKILILHLSFSRSLISLLILFSHSRTHVLFLDQSMLSYANTQHYSIKQDVSNESIFYRNFHLLLLRQLFGIVITKNFSLHACIQLKFDHIISALIHALWYGRFQRHCVIHFTHSNHTFSTYVDDARVLFKHS